MKSTHTTIVWLRKDLRLADHQALIAAAQEGKVLPLYILDPLYMKQQGQASTWWLYHALQDMWNSFNKKLQIHHGSYQEVLVQVAQKYGITKIYVHRVYEPEYIALDHALQSYLQQHGITLLFFQGNLLWQPQDICKADGTYYKVFTPFFQFGCLKSAPPSQPLAKPVEIEYLTDPAYQHKLDTYFQEYWGADWDKARALFWNVSEQGALDRLAIFIRDHLQGYQSGRDFPSLDQTSKLSAYLHWGQISVRTVWHAIWNACRQDQSLQADSMFFIRELCWREFSYNLLYHFPLLPDKNFHDKFDRFPWRYNEQFLKAWQEGKTGYPFVDAGMRELLQTGYMHNRVRMIVASFLIKNLLLDWRHGRDWFWQHLVDADVANNSMSWQWVAGCGVDAAPYFRIFNPTTQGEKFDKQGDYIRKFLPELARLPDKYLFEPHKAPALMLYQAGITLGKTYPYPIVELDVSRKIALQLYHNM